MGKTADLAMIQKTNIDALHKEGNHRGSLLKVVAVYRVLYQSILNAKLTGRQNLARKWCTSTSVSAWRVTTLSHLQEKGYLATSETRNIFRSILPGLRRKRTGLLLSGPMSSFQMKVNFAFNLEIKVPVRVWRKSGDAQNPCCLKSSVTFPESVMICAAMSSAGVGPLCFLKSTVNAAIYQEI